MDLFNTIPDKTVNLLPKDGHVNYYGKVFSKKEADVFYTALLQETDWRPDQAMMFGKLIETKRKIAWYGDEAFSYTYSKITKKALPWTSALLQLKSLTENITEETYNSCLVNLYHTGAEGMAWHSDGEKMLKLNGAIASLSFGAERKFAFKHKQTKEIISLTLEHGSLLLMKGTTQQFWLHRLPPVKQYFGPRINLTFRTIVVQN